MIRASVMMPWVTDPTAPRIPAINPKAYIDFPSMRRVSVLKGDSNVIPSPNQVIVRIEINEADFDTLLADSDYEVFTSETIR